MDRISSSKRRYCRIAFFRRDIAKRRKPAMHAIDPLYSVCGFVGGLLVGMTGAGGGWLMTPLLILLFGVHPATAVGTDLLFAAATRPAAAWSTDWLAPSTGLWSDDLRAAACRAQLSRSWCCPASMSMERQCAT